MSFDARRVDPRGRLPLVLGIRRKRDLSIRQMAAELGVSRAHLAHVEAGNVKPSLKLVGTIRRVYGGTSMQIAGALRKGRYCEHCLGTGRRLPARR